LLRRCRLTHATSQLSHFDFLAGKCAWENLLLSLLKPLGFRRYRLPAPGAPIEAFLESLDNRLAERPGLRGLFHLNLLSIRLRFPEECRRQWNLFWKDAPSTASIQLLHPRVSRSSHGELEFYRFFLSVGMTPKRPIMFIRLPPWAEFLLDEPGQGCSDRCSEGQLPGVPASLPARGSICFPLCIPTGQCRSMGAPWASVGH